MFYSSINFILYVPKGWEERTDACVTFLLRNVLGRGGTGGGQAGRDAPPPPQLIMPQDTGKLKKHVGILLDKVTKAAQQLVLSDQPQDTTAGKRYLLYIHTIHKNQYGTDLY